MLKQWNLYVPGLELVHSGLKPFGLFILRAVAVLDLSLLRRSILKTLKPYRV